MNLKTILLAGIIVCLVAVPFAAAAPFGQNGDVLQTQTQQELQTQDCTGDCNGTGSANCTQNQQQAQICNGTCTCNGTQQQTQTQLRECASNASCAGNGTGQQFQYRYGHQNQQCNKAP